MKKPQCQSFKGGGGRVQKNQAWKEASAESRERERELMGAGENPAEER